MKKLGLALLIIVGGLFLVVVAAGTVFYVKVYRPIGSPLLALAGGRSLEERRLRNHAEFSPPRSAEMTADQVARFLAVEEDVQRRIADGIAILERNRSDLERADEANALSVKAALRSYQDIKAVYLDAKVVQIDAMNGANFSKKEFEWVRQQLYSSAGLPLAQLDVSEVVAGVPEATVVVRRFEAARQPNEHNQRLALPNAAKLERWAVLGFFGL